MLKCPVTGESSIPFTLFAMECEGEMKMDKEENEEEEEDVEQKDQ